MTVPSGPSLEQRKATAATRAGCLVGHVGTVLDAARADGACTAGMVRELLGCDLLAATRVLDALADAGLLRRSADTKPSWAMSMLLEVRRSPQRNTERRLLLDDDGWKD